MKAAECCPFTQWCLSLQTEQVQVPSLILDLLGIADRGTGISIWLIAVILSSAVLILALYLLERHYRRVGEKYDSALSQYKTREEAIPAE